MQKNVGFALSLSAAILFVACNLGGPSQSDLTPPPEDPDSTTQAVEDTQNEIASSEPTRPCVPDKPTPALTEGPYYKEGSPEENELYVAGMTGQKIIISGYVYDTNCTPIPHAWIDIWQADADGAYDNDGYRLRGHTYSDTAGRYSIETEVPGGYEGRTMHIHAKAAVKEDGPVLTTQLFFPGVPNNATDDIYEDELLVDLDTSTNPWKGTFNFVLSNN